MCWDNDKKETKKSMLLCPNQPLPTNKPGRERQSMCYDEKMEYRQRYILLWQPFQLKNKQNRTGHKLYANWYNQRSAYQCNGKNNLTPYQKVHQPRRKAEDAPTPPSEARRPRTQTTWILSTLVVDFMLGRNLAGFWEFRHYFDRPQFQPP